MKIKIWNYLGSVLLMMMFIGHAAAAVVTKTEVITYKPSSAAPADVRNGSCFATSVAFPREDAWRCIINNAIYDPCFNTADKGVLLCNVNPVTATPGFGLRLTQNLPQPDKLPAEVLRIWMLVLEDGSVCTPFTGSLPLLNYNKDKIGLQYGCVDGAGNKTGLLYNSVQPGELWRAKQVIYSKDKKAKTSALQVDVINDVVVKTVWR